MSGFTAVGMDVFLLGPMPTPAVAMLTRSLRADLGVMISASHNPFADNGIKLFDPDGYKLSDEAEAEIEALMDAGSESLLVPPDRIGRAKRIDSAQERYIEFAKRTLPRDIRLNGLRVVIDCANGAGYQVAPAVLWELGAEVIKIGVEPNGRNINEECGSTDPEALCEKVRERRADIGIALDGDADRVVIVDEKGRIVDGDQIMALIAESWQRKRPARRGRRRRHRHVQPRAGALPEVAGPRAGAHAGRRPLCRRAHAPARLQRRRRAVRPHRAVRLHHHRRRPGRGAAGALGRGRHRQAGERGVQALRSGAAADGERALRQRRPARARQGQERHRSGQGAARRDTAASSCAPPAPSP